MYKIAIIGSRETPEDTMQEMLDVLQRGFKILRNKQHKIETRSGGKLWLRKLHPNVDFRVIPQDIRYRGIVASLHPNPDKLSDIAWALHGRNLNSVSGDALDNPVDAVYYYAEHDKKGNPKGGTAMGVRYAQSLNIPCYYHVTDASKWLEDLRLL